MGDNELAHYGVKGMKWGKRKGITGTVTRSSDYEQTAHLRKKKPYEMSNDELKTLNTRLNLEQQYAKLNPKTTTKGKTIVASVLGTAGLGVSGYNMVNSPAGKAFIKLAKNTIFKANYASGITKAITK